MLPAKRRKMLRLLYVEAFIIWLIGFIITGILGVSLITDAANEGTTKSSSTIIIWCCLGAVFAISIALIVYIFIPLAIKNIQRISKLEKPKVIIALIIIIILITIIIISSINVIVLGFMFILYVLTLSLH